MEWSLSIPSNVLICGPSGSGKTSFVERLLDTPDAWQQKPEKIYYCYGCDTDNVKNIMSRFPQVVLMQGLPRNLGQPEEIFDKNLNNLLILDDLSGETQNSKAMTEFMVKGTHHRRVCLLSLEHFLFSDAKERRRQSIHWHQIILFRSLRTLKQISILGSQGVGCETNLLKWAFRDATSKPYGYLIIDTRNETPDELRVLTNVFHENNSPSFIYL